MLRTATVVSLLTLTLAPACDDGKDPAPNDGESASETDVGDTEEEEGASSSETGDDEDASSSTGADDGADEGMGEDSVTPVVLAFRGEAVQFNTAVAAGFDLTGTMSVVTDWPTSTTPWLALDRNGNGRIDDGGELFGSATLLASGEAASNGFAALAELDSNADGKLDASDEQWGRLLVWSDVDSDRVSAPYELKTAAARDVVAIELAYAIDRRCDGRGNCEVERASFVYRDGRGRELQGAAVDVHLRMR